MALKLNNNTKIIQRKYDRFASFYDKLEGFMEGRAFGKWRSALLCNLKGRILEVGVGTGKNLKYYNRDAKVTGIDISSKMLERAVEKSKKLKRGFKLLQMDAQSLKLKDNGFDNVICTFVLCSVPNPIKVVKEMDRVCKKSGKILMLEHVLSKHKIIAFLEHLHNPITRTLFGFNVNRKTTENIKKAGLNINKEINLNFFDVFKRIEIQKGGVNYV